MTLRAIDFRSFVAGVILGVISSLLVFFLLLKDEPAGDEAYSRGVPPWAFGRWTPLKRHSDEHQQIMNLRFDWEYNWLETDWHPRRAAVGRFWVDGGTVTVEPDYFSIDAESCGGRMMRRFTRSTLHGRPALVRDDGALFVLTYDWKDLRKASPEGDGAGTP